MPNGSCAARAAAALPLHAARSGILAAMKGMLVCLAALVAVSAAGATSSEPRLSLAQYQPLTLRGQGFEPHELVRVSARLNARAPVKAGFRAGAQGGFMAPLKTLRLGRCGNELSVSAVGGRGSRVSWTLTQRDCQD